ncbi:dopaminechrome tautomerase [Prorops nasuta]|uniref:dopaminechrome tautomerase n=1 Tax=Prorops nasuta TaxID=863751 RepID=UPI0034CE3ACC
MRFLWLLLITGSCWFDAAKGDVLETIAQWPLLDFALPYDPHYLDQFKPENVVPTGIEIGWNRIFISVPRLRDGVPATLNFIPRNIPPGSSPQLHAYPSWDWHGAGIGDLNCSKLISVYRIRIDRCNRLWVVDSGIMTSIDDFRVVCPPKIVVFDLQTDRLVRLYTFPRQSLRPNSLLTNMIIDDVTATTCDDVFVYISDTTGPGIVVFDGATDRSWRVLHTSMFPDPSFSTYQIGGDSFELMDGVVGLAFSPQLNTLYYQPLATNLLFSVPTSALQGGPLPFGEQLPVTVVGKKSSQGLALAVDPQDDTILFSPLTETAIASWHPRTNQQRIIAFSPQQLQFTAELKFAERDNGDLWILSTRFQKFFRRQISPREINLRIMRIRFNSNNVPKPGTFYLSHQQQRIPHYFYNNTVLI